MSGNIVGIFLMLLVYRTKICLQQLMNAITMVHKMQRLALISSSNMEEEGHKCTTIEEESEVETTSEVQQGILAWFTPGLMHLIVFTFFSVYFHSFICCQKGCCLFVRIWCKLFLLYNTFLFLGIYLGSFILH